MQKSEKFFRNIFSNVIIGISVFAVFFVAFNTAYSPVKANPEGAIYKGESEDKVSLMINVYWGTEYLDSMLTAFDQKKLATTFFVGGSWVSDNEEMLKKISFYGHEIGNHGYFHKDHTKLSAERNREEILVTHKLVASMLNVEMNLFAPPSGAFSKTTIEEAKKLGYQTIMWTYDTIDWRDQNVSLIVKRATQKISGGSLILMHPTKATAEALPQILQIIEQKGLKVAPVSEVLVKS